MKFISLLIGAAVAKPLLHPDTGLAITTTGYHWYGQEPLALSQKARHQEGVRFVGDNSIWMMSEDQLREDCQKWMQKFKKQGLHIFEVCCKESIKYLSIY